jgi:hypothetical protein
VGDNCCKCIVGLCWVEPGPWLTFLLAGGTELTESTGSADKQHLYRAFSTESNISLSYAIPAHPRVARLSKVAMRQGVSKLTVSDTLRVSPSAGLWVTSLSSVNMDQPTADLLPCTW